MIGHWEILIIFIIILLLFGGKKIPEVARGLGKGLREFKKAKKDVTDSLNQAIEEDEKEKEEGKKEETDSKETDSDDKSEEKEKDSKKK